MNSYLIQLCSALGLGASDMVRLMTAWERLERKSEAGVARLKLARHSRAFWFSEQDWKRWS